MTFTEARLRLGMGETAFYKLKNRLGIKAVDRQYKESDIQRMEEAKRNFRVWTKYRVSVRKGPYFVVKHVGVSKAEALRLCQHYHVTGQKAIAISCDGKNTRLV